MKAAKYFALSIGFMWLATSCGNNPDNHGTSQPIDSTNVKGAAPATYGPEDPARDQNTDTNRQNVDDTGTNANNVHNMPHEHPVK